MDTKTIQFIQVGPRKLSWTADVPRPVTHHGLMREIRKHHALGSYDVEFDDNGSIYVGLFRRVGYWKAIEQPASADAVARVIDDPHEPPTRANSLSSSSSEAVK